MLHIETKVLEGQEWRNNETGNIVSIAKVDGRLVKVRTTAGKSFTFTSKKLSENYTRIPKKAVFNVDQGEALLGYYVEEVQTYRCMNQKAIELFLGNSTLELV